MRAASWIGFSLTFLAIFGFLLVITQQGEFPAITPNKIVNTFVETTLASAVVAITAALAVGIAAEKIGLFTSPGGSAAMASVKAAIYGAAATFVCLWAIWIGNLLINLVPTGMPVWMSILFIVPILVPTVWAIVSEYMGHKS